MAKWIEFPVGSTAVPIELTINDRFGGTPGQIPYIQIRRTTDAFYLDFADQTFKAGGQTQLQYQLPDLGSGFYRFLWDSSVAIPTPTIVAIEYYNEGGLAPGIDDDTYTFSLSAAILARLATSPCASVGPGPGNCRYQYLLTQANSAVPLVGATVYVTSDIAGGTIIAGPTLTDASGKVIFYLNASTQYYVWRTLGGYKFSNPQVISF